MDSRGVESIMDTDLFYVAYELPSEEQAESLQSYFVSHGVQALNSETEVSVPLTNPSRVTYIYQLRQSWNDYWRNHMSTLFDLPVYVKDSPLVKEYTTASIFATSRMSREISGDSRYFVTADAEQAKQTGGMIAFRVSRRDAQNLAIPGFETVEDLHITLLYLGEDVPEQCPLEIVQACDSVTQQYEVIEANVFAHAQFNPDTEESCAVYLVGNASQLEELRSDIRCLLEGLDIPPNHTPWIPHITAGYGLPSQALEYIGPVLVDRITLNWRGRESSFDLIPTSICM